MFSPSFRDYVTTLRVQFLRDSALWHSRGKECAPPDDAEELQALIIEKGGGFSCSFKRLCICVVVASEQWVSKYYQPLPAVDYDYRVRIPFC